MHAYTVIGINISPGTIYYLSDGLETRVPPYYKAHISVSAIIVTVKKNIASNKKLQRLLRNTNSGRPDNGVNVCEGVYSKP